MASNWCAVLMTTNPNPTSTAPTRKLKQPGPGRPRLTTDVKLNPEGGRSQLHSASLRRQVVEYLLTCPNGVASREELEVAFGGRVRHALLKLEEVGWVERT